MRQRQQQVAALSGQLQAVQLQLEIWEGKVRGVACARRARDASVSRPA